MIEFRDAREDYPAIAYLADCAEETGKSPEAVRMLRELNQLRRWKAEATQVLRDWDQVWEALSRPGALGASKALSALDVLRQHDLDGAVTCDWGDCDDEAVTWRMDPGMTRQLPVCERHRPAREETT